MAKRIEIRASSLTSYPDCLRRTAARIFKSDIEDAGFKLRQPPTGIGAATGSATHTGAAYMLRGKIERGEQGDEADAIELAIDALRADIEPGVTWDKTSPGLNTAERQVVRQVRSYGRYVAPNIEPETVEEYLEQPLKEGGNIWVTGHTDVKIERGIRDLKTGSMRRANGYQYGTYSLLYRSAGLEVDFLIEDFIPRVSINKEQPRPEVHHYDVAEAENAAYAIIKHMVGDLQTFRETGDPWSFLANPMSVLCSAKYCPAHSTPFCRAHIQEGKK